MKLHPQLARPLTQTTASLANLRQGSLQLKSQPAVQFGGPDFGGIFKLILAVSGAFWTGLAGLGVGAVGYQNHTHTPQAQLTAKLDSDFKGRLERVQASAATLGKVSPDKATEAISAHQKLVQQEFAGVIQEIKQVVNTNTTNQAVIDALASSTLTPEDQANTAKILQETDFKTWEDPIKAFDTFADTVLAKHANADIVAQSKEAIRTLTADQPFDKNTAQIYLAVAIVGAMAAAGALGFSLIAGLEGIKLTIIGVPLVIFGTLFGGLRRY